MTSKFFSSKLFAVLFIIVLLIIFNMTRRPLESQTSKEFQNVVGTYEAQSKAALKEGRPVSKVAISVKSAVPSASLNFALDNSLKTDDPITTGTIVHLLDLLYESGVITKQGPSNGTFQVKVEVNNQLFDGSFEERDVAEKRSLATFLKLMQLHGHTQAVAQNIQ